MRMIAVKYVKTDTRNGHLIYRRRVPKALASVVTETEFVKMLGRTEQEAILAYGPYHQYIEHLLALARSGVTGLSPTEQRARLKAMLESWGADPYSPGRDDNERTWREATADRMVEKYQNPGDGEYEGVPEKESVIASALYKGIPKTNPEPTLTDAFKFYLTEKALTEPEKLRKQVQRINRAERRLIAAVGSDRLLSEVNHADARTWRDMRVRDGAKPTTIRREKNDICAVIGLAQT